MQRLFIVALIACAFVEPSYAARFDMRDAIHRNSILVVSEAPLERVIALTHFVSGAVELEPNNLSAGVKGQIEFDVRTFETGLELHNVQLRDQFLLASEFPTATATFQVTGLKGKMIDGEPLKLKPEFDVNLRGIARKVLIPIELTYFKESETTKARLAGNLLRARSLFTIDTSVFGISIPESLKSVFNKSVQVSVELIGSDRLPTGFSPLPEAPKAKK